VQTAENKKHTIVTYVVVWFDVYKTKYCGKQKTGLNTEAPVSMLITKANIQQSLMNLTPFSKQTTLSLVGVV
jgi:hypothetical protein